MAQGSFVRTRSPTGQATPATAQALAQLLAQQREGPEVQQQLEDTRLCGLELHQQHVGKQKQEQQVTDHVTQEGGHWGAPEVRPALGEPTTAEGTSWPPSTSPLEGHLCGGFRSPARQQASGTTEPGLAGHLAI